MASRPVVTVYDLEGKKVSQIKTPAVFSAPIRSDVVNTVHTFMRFNGRQAYAVKHMAGMGHSAESWGTGRAVARIPRVSGSGTARAGQAAFGNMCRKGRMFAPTKTWRKWHRKIAVNQRRYATVSAIAATAVPALVMARGHAIGQVAEIPLVVDDALESITKTKAAVAALKALGAGADVAKAKATRTTRSGVARMRSRVHTGRKSVLVVFNKDNGIVKAFRNIPGVDLCNVSRLNLLSLAPGATLGRFVVFTKSAAEALNTIYGSVTNLAAAKKGYHLPRSVMANADLDRIINSNEIQSVLKFKSNPTKAVKHFNGLTNFKARVALNPYAAVVRKAEMAAQLRAKAVREAKLAAIKAGKPVPRTASEAKKKAATAASKKISALTAQWVINGKTATAEELKAAQFDVKKFKTLSKQRVAKNPRQVVKAEKVFHPKRIAAFEAIAALKKASVNALKRAVDAQNKL